MTNLALHAYGVAVLSWVGAMVAEAVQSPAVSLGSVALALIGLVSLWVRERYALRRAELHSRDDAAELLAYRRLYGPLSSAPRAK